MAILIVGPRLHYGVPGRLPQIRGFEILCRRDHFTIARQGRHAFYLEQFAKRYRLFPIDGDGFMRTDRAVSIPREDIGADARTRLTPFS